MVRNDWIEVVVDGGYGVYAPQVFIEKYQSRLHGVDVDDIISLLNGPEDEWYWEAWENVLDNGVLEDDDGNKWRIYQDQDIFIIRHDVPDEVLQDLFG